MVTDRGLAGLSFNDAGGEREAFAERRKEAGDVFKYDSFLVFKGKRMVGRYTLLNDRLKKVDAIGQIR